MLGMFLIDRAGRRKLMYIGSFGYIVSLGAVSWAFFSGNLSGAVVPIWLFVFIASHAIGQGAVRLGVSFGSATHWVFAALIGGNFPYLASTFGEGPIFALFAGCMVLQLLFVHFLMPETKGVDLEQLQRQLEG